MQITRRQLQHRSALAAGALCAAQSSALVHAIRRWPTHRLGEVIRVCAPFIAAFRDEWDDRQKQKACIDPMQAFFKQRCS